MSRMSAFCCWTHASHALASCANWYTSITVGLSGEIISPAINHMISFCGQFVQLDLYFITSIMASVKKMVAKFCAFLETAVTSVNLCFCALVDTHCSLNTRNVSVIL
uniref:Secreted protein n=1 Tax=Ciona intestinalis TaxID=7719 RepID=H2XXE0_CIOIN